MRTRARTRFDGIDLLGVAIVAAVGVRLALPGIWRAPAVSAWLTVFAAICVQATPYLVLGVVAATAVAVLVPAAVFGRLLPARDALAVPVAGLAGAALPGCECGSVPTAAALLRRGVAPGPAVAFVLAAPAVNPVVLVATAVAFPNRPDMVAARFVASLVAAVVVGWAWLRLGVAPRLPPPLATASADGRWRRATVTATHDLAQGLGLLVVGAACAATVTVAAPTAWLTAASGAGLRGVLVLGVLAVLIAVCSEADAFVASSFTGFSPTAQLAFMVVGPMVDVKLIAMQLGTFGVRATVRLAPAAFVAGLASAVLVGRLLL